jgi:hypothetical protein
MLAHLTRISWCILQHSISISSTSGALAYKNTTQAINRNFEEMEIKRKQVVSTTSMTSSETLNFDIWYYKYIHKTIGCKMQKVLLESVYKYLTS